MRYKNASLLVIMVVYFGFAFWCNINFDKRMQRDTAACVQTLTAAGASPQQTEAFRTIFQDVGRNVNSYVHLIGFLTFMAGFSMVQVVSKFSK